jgi:hypothetical protein
MVDQRPVETKITIKNIKAERDECVCSGFAGVGERIESGVECGEDEEERLKLCDFEQVCHTVVHAGQNYLLPGFVAGNVGANERAESGGIDVGDLGEVENERRSMLAANGVLEGRKVIGGQRPFENEHPLSRIREGAFDDEGFGLHKNEPSL